MLLMGGEVSPTLLLCRKEDGLKVASLNTRVSKNRYWVATVSPVCTKIISQRKLLGEAAKEKGRDQECLLSSLPGGNSRTLG